MAATSTDEDDIPPVPVRCGVCDRWAPRHGLRGLGGRPITDQSDWLTVGELRGKGWTQSSDSKSGWLCPACAE